jgi:hypothetical protein
VLRPLDGLSQLGNGTQSTSAVATHTVCNILTADGVLAASYAQEALLRIPN